MRVFELSVPQLQFIDLLSLAFSAELESLRDDLFESVSVSGEMLGALTLHALLKWLPYLAHWNDLRKLSSVILRLLDPEVDSNRLLSTVFSVFYVKSGSGSWGRFSSSTDFCVSYVRVVTDPEVDSRSLTALTFST